MIRTSKLHIIGALATTALALTACGIEADEAAEPTDVQIAQDGADRVDAADSAGGVLVSPELFELTARWSAQSLAPEKALSTDPGLDLIAYVHAHAPALADEAERALMRMVASSPDGFAAKSSCACTILGTFNVPTAYLTGGSVWSLGVSGAAHSGRIYQSQSGHKTEHTADTAAYRTEFRTRMSCVTPQGTACAGGCTAKLHADVQYSTHVYAEAHTWTIWDKAGTTQIVDGVILDLRTPYGGAGQRITEKAVSVSHSATSTAFQPGALAQLVKSGLAIFAAIKTGDISVIGPDLVDKTIDALFGLIQRQAGRDGSTSQSMNVAFESYFDGQPINISYASSDPLYYGLDLTSQVKMKVRGWGYHSETGEVRSSYSVATYVDSFVCDAGVTPPLRSGFWRYDAYAGAPLTASSLQSRIRSFFYLALGTWITVSQQQGSVTQ